MYRIDNFLDNENIRLRESGPFSIVEYVRDVSVDKAEAVQEYYASKMNVHKRQIICDLEQCDGGVIVQAGAMQWMLGDVTATTNVKSIGGFFKKAASAAVTGETVIKPLYSGVGLLALEPTYNHIVDLKIQDWGGSICISDGAFLACEGSLDIKVVPLSVSASLLGGNGIFVNQIRGAGTLLMESDVPFDEMIEITLKDDVIRVDGDLALAWTSGLDFTVERTTATLIGSAASGEGLVSVYRGSGKLLMMPVR